MFVDLDKETNNSFGCAISRRLLLSRKSGVLAFAVARQLNEKGEAKCHDVTCSKVKLQ